jgi:hypothetical protein
MKQEKSYFVRKTEQHRGGGWPEEICWQSAYSGPFFLIIVMYNCALVTTFSLFASSHFVCGFNTVIMQCSEPSLGNYLCLCSCLLIFQWLVSPGIYALQIIFSQGEHVHIEVTAMIAINNV